jgi:hypothetical protein
MSSQILLSLCAGCTMAPLPRKGEPLAFLDIPAFVAEELELRGLVLPVDLVRGKSATDLERFRDEADRAHCPCLSLVHDSGLDFGADAEGATKILTGLMRAAKLLGCGEVAVRLSGASASTDVAVAPVRAVLQSAHAQDMNLLLRPTLDPLLDPAVLIERVKQIGGFHIGAMPTFAHAAATDDGIGTLRKLAPYAGVIEATVAGFAKDGQHSAWDLTAYVEALVSYGYTNKLAIAWDGKTNWVTGVERARERFMQLLGREESVG